MNVDCHWIEEKLEAFFCDSLTPDESRALHSHVDSCNHCRSKIEELRAIDPLIHRVFQQNLTMARQARPRRSPLTIGAFAMATLSVVLLAFWMMPRSSSNVETAQSSKRSSASAVGAVETPVAPKVSDNAAPDRAKPDSTVIDRPSDAPQAPGAKPAGKPVPDFLITDLAGYSRTLADYKGSVLIFGVIVQNQPQGISNLQRVYETFGKNTKLRIVGISKTRLSQPSGATFTMAYNAGSALLGASPSDLVIVDASGSVRFRGSLLDSSASILNSVGTTLHQLNIQ